MRAEFNEYNSNIIRHYTARVSNLVLKFLRVSSGKLTTRIILEQEAEFEH